MAKGLGKENPSPHAKPRKDSASSSKVEHDNLAIHESSGLSTISNRAPPDVSSVQGASENRRARRNGCARFLEISLGIQTGETTLSRGLGRQ